MIELSNQKLIPNYAHRLNLFFSYHLGNSFLFMNKKLIGEINSTLKFIIGFYLGKKTTRCKREDSISNIEKFFSLITDFTKIMNANNPIICDIELCKVYIHQVSNDLRSNQNGNIKSEGS